MKIVRLMRFVASAVWHRKAYIDLDGCLLQRFRVPESVNENHLQWWIDNLAPTPIVKRRLCMLYALKLCGVKLHIWTNRSPQHERITCEALGKHVRLFSSASYLAGHKGKMPRSGPSIDDELKYVGTRFNDFHVTAE